MIRLATTVIFAAVAVVLAVAHAPVPALAEQDIMQCMERCLRHEGRDQKDTCKLRCADVPLTTRPDGRPAGGHDCMGRYKTCQKDCGHDRDCHKACKTELMGCK